MRRLIFGTVFVLSLGACSSGKSLFSSWTSKTSGAVYNLTAGSLGTAFSMTFIFTGGSQCQSTINLTGSESSGTFIITNSTYVGGGSGDPGCSSLNSTGSFSKSDTELSLCPAGSSCSVLQ